MTRERPPVVSYRWWPRRLGGLRNFQVEPLELHRRPVSVMSQRPCAGAFGDRMTPLVISKQISDGSRKRVGLRRRNRRRVWRPVVQVTNGRSHDGDTARRCLERHDRGCLVPGRDDQRVRALIERNQFRSSQRAMKRHVFLQSEPTSQGLNGAAERVFADDVEVDAGWEHGVDYAAHGVQQQRLVLNGVQVSHMQQAPLPGALCGTGSGGVRWSKDVTINTDRDHGSRATVLPSQLLHQARTDGDTRCQTCGDADGNPMTTVPLQPVSNVGQRHELAAVGGDQGRDAEATASKCRDDARGHGPIGVEHVERSIAPQRSHQRGILPQQAFGTSEIMDCGAQQCVRTRLIVITQHVDRYVMAPGKPLNQRKENGDDAVNPAAVDATSYYQRNAQDTRFYRAR